MDKNQYVGIALMAVAVIDEVACEIPRLTEPDTNGNLGQPWYGFTIAQSGWIGTICDIIIFYGGYLLYTS